MTLVAEGSDLVLNYGLSDMVRLVGLSLADWQAHVSPSDPGNATIIGTSASETLEGTTESDVLWGGAGDDFLSGGLGADTYRYGSGDGNDTISDAQSSASVTDRLLFTNLSAENVSFSQSTGSDLIVNLSSGETITVIDHFEWGYAHAIEEVEFADGVTLDLQGIRDKSAADMKATGAVLGSIYAENYVHTAGDGSYTILDEDRRGRNGTDRLAFTDADAADVAFSRTSGSDLVMTLANGETITVIDQFAWERTFAIEEMEFADGTVLDLQGIRDKSAADMKATGAVLGSVYAENYVHTAGDGSYTILDEDQHGRNGTDRLVFTDADAADAAFSRTSGDDLVMTLANGETITVIDQFAWERTFAIEEMEFADGTVLDLQGIRDKSAADMKATGAVLGSVYAENYVHTAGDGSYTILDEDQHGRNGTDRLVFTDADAADAAFSRTSGDDLVMTLANGETITVIDQFAWGHTFAIEEMEFADGVTLDLQGIEDRLWQGTERDDTFVAGSGDDTLSGRAGADDLQGGGGNDTLVGGIGSDMLAGGSGADSFVFSEGDGADVITDFDIVDDTLLFMEVGFEDLTINQDGPDVRILYGSTDEIIVLNASAADFTEPELQFV